MDIYFNKHVCFIYLQVNSIVYILDENSEDLFADKEKKHAVPSKGIVRFETK